MTGGADEALEQALAAGVVAVVRLPDAMDPVPAALAVADGGIRAVEITLTSSRAIEAVGRLVASDTGALVGAGSVRTPADVRACVEAGARFLVTPTTWTDVIAEAVRLGIPVIAGGLTPSELDAAHQAGATMQKLFPASHVGPSYLRDVLAPMPQLRIVPTGGVGLSDVADWRAAGSVGVGVGSELVDARTVAAGDLDELQQRARRLVRAWSRSAP